MIEQLWAWIHGFPGDTRDSPQVWSPSVITGRQRGDSPEERSLFIFMFNDSYEGVIAYHVTEVVHRCTI